MIEVLVLDDGDDAEAPDELDRGHTLVWGERDEVVPDGETLVTSLDRRRDEGCRGDHGLIGIDLIGGRSSGGHSRRSGRRQRRRLLFGSDLANDTHPDASRRQRSQQERDDGQRYGSHVHGCLRRSSEPPDGTDGRNQRYLSPSSHLGSPRRINGKRHMTTHDLVGSWKLVDWTVRMNGGREVRPDPVIGIPPAVAVDPEPLVHGVGAVFGDEP